MFTPEKAACLVLDSLMSNNANVITHLKLQKILYYAQAWNIVFTGEKLFNSDIEAWVHGPVVPEVYQLYKIYRYSNIKHEKNEPNKKSTHPVIQSVCSVYGHCSPKFLENLTHSESPWLNARKGLKATQKSRRKISVADMKYYYSRIAHDKRDFSIDSSAVLIKRRIISSKNTRANNIFQGIGSVLDIYPDDQPMRGYESRDFHNEDSDWEAIYSDWEHVGSDIQKAFGTVRKAEHTNE